MTFTQTIKKELLRKNWSKLEFFEFLFGVVLALGKEKGNVILIRVHNQDLALLLQRYIRIFSLEKHIRIGKKDWEIDLNYLREQKEQINIDLSKMIVIGLFVAHGAVSNPKNSRYYHLEIMFRYADYLTVKNFFLSQKQKMDFSYLRRGNFHVLYLKKSDQISDFLKFVGASRSVMIFEDERIRRDFNNNLNRLTALEMHNQERLSNLSFELNSAIQIIEKNEKMKEFTPGQRAFMRLKKRFPGDSLQSLSERLKKKKFKISKSGLSHWARKIKDFANLL